MSLLATAQQLQEELDARKSKLDKREQAVSEKESAVESRASELEDRAREISSRESAASFREAQILAAEAQEARVTELHQLEATHLQHLAEQRARETELAAMLAGIKQREEAVATREQAVSDREVTYKQTLKEEFFKELAKRAP